MIRRKKGTIALTTLLVLTTTLTLVGISIVYLSIDSASISRSYYNLNIAKSYSQSCLDEALFKIALNPSFTGSGELNNQSNNCSYIVENDPVVNTTKNINIISNFETSNYSKIFRVDSTTTPITVLE